MYRSLPNLIEKLREIGDIKVADVIYEVKIPEKDYEYLTQSGFNYKVVPGNLVLNLLSDTYDLILSDDSIDTLVFGTTNDNLIPLVTELRKKVTIFALINKQISKAFEEAFDGIIDIAKVDEFIFTTTDLSEIDSIIGTQGDLISHDPSQEWGSINNDANIGPVSEDLEEQVELVEELKLKEQIKNGKGNSKQKIKKDERRNKEQLISKKSEAKIKKADKVQKTEVEVKTVDKSKKAESEIKKADKSKKVESEIKKTDKSKKAAGKAKKNIETKKSTKKKSPKNE